MKTRVLVLILMLIGARLLYDAGAPPPREEDATPQLNLAGGVGVVDRLQHGVGVYGAMLAEPAVRELLRGHARDLEALQLAARKAPPRRQARAEGAIRRIVQLDSLALARIDTGNPVAALQLAMQAGGLVEAVREEMIEESLIR